MVGWMSEMSTTAAGRELLPTLNIPLCKTEFVPRGDQSACIVEIVVLLYRISTESDPHGSALSHGRTGIIPETCGVVISVS